MLTSIHHTKSESKKSNSFFSPATIQPKLTIGQPNDKYEQEADAMADRVMRMPENTLQKKSSACEEETIQKQPSTTATTPCPSSVSIGTLRQFNHSNLPTAEKDNWRTYLGVASQMNVGPGPDHTGHCMKERLTTITNTCPTEVYFRGGQQREPCTGNKCLDINRYGRSGDGLTRSMVNDGPTSFVDLHRTRSRTQSLLEGTGISSCRVVCDQEYTCDRTGATTGKFCIIRNYQAGLHTKADGTQVHITTGTVEKINAPGPRP